MRKLSKAESFYIEQHARTMDVQGIATDLGVDVRTVKAYIRKLPEPTPEAVPEAKPAGDDSEFMRHKTGAVCMTETQGQIDDERRPQQNYLKRNSKNIHVIDPSKPVR